MDLKPQQIERINLVLGGLTDDMTVMGEAVYNFLIKQPKAKRAQYLCYALQNKPFLPKSAQALKNPGLTETEWKNFLANEIGIKLARQLNQILESEHQSAVELAGRLWDIVIHHDSRQAKIFVMSVILHSRLVPLILPAECPGAVSMSDEEFAHLREKYLPRIINLREIKNANITFVNKAAAIYHLLQEVKTKEEQAILMAILQLPISDDFSAAASLTGYREIPESVIDELKDEASQKAIILHQILNSEFFVQKTQTGGAIWHYLQQENEDMAIILLASVLVSLKRNEIAAEIIVTVRMPGDLPNWLDSLAETLQSTGKRPANKSRADIESHNPEDCFVCDQADCPKHPNHKDKVPGGFVCSHTGEA